MVPASRLEGMKGATEFRTTHRGGGARRDVEERHPTLGAVWECEMFRHRGEGLQVGKHLICLVNAVEQGPS